LYIFAAHLQNVGGIYIILYMKKILTFFTLVVLFITTLLSQTNIVFNGDSLDDYLNQTVTFDQTLHVCGHYENTLYLSYERLRQPEEIAIIGTPAFDAERARCDAGILTAYFQNVLSDTVRTGATITNLTARVTAGRELYVTENPIFNNNTRPTSRPNVGNARLIICGANVQYYCPEWEGTYGAGSDAEFQTQHTKLMKAFMNINADIYSLTEIQDGPSALESITNGLNALTAPGRYAYVADGDDETTTYTKVGFIYRTDKVTPILQLGYPYTSNSVFYRREYVQAFRENATQERFVLSMNHFKAKDGTGSESTNYARMDNVEKLVDFLDIQLQNNYYLDGDILILGDLNCSTMEEPIRYLDDHGYENQLTRFAPEEYSYVYHNEIEYLDHAFCSPSMSPQITGVMPYHLNADESYSFYYPSGDTTMYRYADHDPIIIGVNLFSETDTTCYDIDYSESFQSSLGNFQTSNVLGTSSWMWYSSYNCAYMNGYNSGANEDWLISPYFDLQRKDSAVLEFTHALAYGSSPATWTDHCRLMLSTNFQGNVQTATWEEIEIPNMPTANWQWQSNTILLPQRFIGEPSVVVAFKYTIESVDDSPAWEIKNFLFRAPCVENEVGIEQSKPVDKEANVFSRNGSICVQSASPVNITVFDLVGRTVFAQSNTTHCECTVPQGIYIVRVGNQAYKLYVPRF
jgi:hypothetical protein